MKPTNRLEYSNNWESDEYWVDGKRIRGLQQVEIDGVKYTVNTRRVGVRYYDMGHDYTAHSDHYFITEKVFGIKTEFDLNELVRKKRILAIKFTAGDEA